MNLEQQVASRARWLDGVKPGWEQLVPLTNNAVSMLGGCAPCILDFVFTDEVGNSSHGGWQWARSEYTEVGDCEGAFLYEDALPFWNEEISARLACWAPSDVAHEVPSDAAHDTPSAAAAQATVDA